MGTGRAKAIPGLRAEAGRPGRLDTGLLGYDLAKASSTGWESMYATQVSVRIESGREDEARRSLAEQVLPRVKGSPGFVAGYWFAAQGNTGSSLVIWQTKDHAEAAAALMQPGDHPAPPVTVERVEVREVIESI